VRRRYGQGVALSGVPWPLTALAIRAVFVKFQQGGSAEYEARRSRPEGPRAGEGFLGKEQPAPQGGCKPPSPPARGSGGAL